MSSALERTDVDAFSLLSCRDCKLFLTVLLSSQVSHSCVQTTAQTPSVSPVVPLTVTSIARKYSASCASQPEGPPVFVVPTKAPKKSPLVFQRNTSSSTRNSLPSPTIVTVPRPITIMPRLVPPRVALTFGEPMRLVAATNRLNSTPGTSNISTSFTSYTSTPGTSYTSTPGTSYTSTPGTSYTSTPSTSYTSTPGTSYTSTPGTSYTSTPGTSYTSTPYIRYNSSPCSSSSKKTQ